MYNRQELSIKKREGIQQTFTMELNQGSDCYKKTTQNPSKILPKLTLSA
jgi:hypothetical protein